MWHKSGSQGCLAPGPHNTPHAGPHGAFPPDWKAHPSGRLQSGLRHRPPEPLHLVRCNAATEVCGSPLCRRFRPSPCPTHYDGRWATTPSADCCAITARRCHRARCPDRGRVRWELHVFRRGPQSGSHGDRGDLRVRWLIHAFQHGPQFDSHRHPSRRSHRSPRIRT